MLCCLSQLYKKKIIKLSVVVLNYGPKFSDSPSLERCVLYPLLRNPGSLMKMVFCDFQDVAIKSREGFTFLHGACVPTASNAMKIV